MLERRSQDVWTQARVHQTWSTCPHPPLGVSQLAVLLIASIYQPWFRNTVLGLLLDSALSGPSYSVRDRRCLRSTQPWTQLLYNDFEIR